MSRSLAIPKALRRATLGALLLVALNAQIADAKPTDSCVVALEDGTAQGAGCASWTGPAPQPFDVEPCSGRLPTPQPMPWPLPDDEIA